MASRPQRSARGITLVECLLAVTVLSATVLAITYTVVAAQQQINEADVSVRAARLARDLLEEITSRSYQDPDQTPLAGPESGETGRSLYDDVDDYGGYAEAVGQMRDASGQLYAAADQVFGRSVTVASATRTIEAMGCSVAGIQVTVTLQHSSGRQWQFSRFIANPHP